MKRTNKVISVVLLSMMALGIYSSLRPGMSLIGDKAGGSDTPTRAAAPPTEEEVKGDDGSLESLGGGYVYRRIGGIAGFCDVVAIETGKAATVSSCRSDPAELVGEVELSPAQAAQLDEWVARLASFDHEQSDPAVADGMTILINFTGNGGEEPSNEDIIAMDALANEILISIR